VDEMVGDADEVMDDDETPINFRVYYPRDDIDDNDPISDHHLAIATYSAHQDAPIGSWYLVQEDD
jgi:hypothetical protein